MGRMAFDFRAVAFLGGIAQGGAGIAKQIRAVIGPTTFSEVVGLFVFLGLRKMKHKRQQHKNNCAALKKNDAGKFVVPVVMIVEGVLNGGLVTAAEFGKNADQWNGKPVVIRHPTSADGDPMTANSPEVFNSSLIGFLFNVRVDGERLVGEMHLEEEKICAAGFCGLSDILKSGGEVEVSTGYMCDVEAAQGEHNGTPYTEIQSGILPDHLAVLVDEEGACSLADGCGTNRISNAKEFLGKLIRVFNFRKVNDMKRKEKLLKLQALADKALKANSISKKQHDAVIKFASNEKLTAEQFEIITDMDEEQLATAALLIEAQAELPAEVSDNKDDDDDDDKKQVAAEITEEKLEEEIEKFATNGKLDAIFARQNKRRAIVANSDFTMDDLKTMGDAALDKLHDKYVANSDTDYSGMGGSTRHNSGVVVANAAMIPGGLAGSLKQAK